MSQVLPPGQEDDEIEGLAILVAENLQEGESPEKIVQQLVSNGWEQDDAVGFVGSIQHRLEMPQYTDEESANAGGGYSWLYWIGAIILYRIISDFLN